MSTHSAKNNSGLLQKLARLIVGSSRLRDPDDPRSRSWARQVNSYADLPEIYCAFLGGLSSLQGQPFPYTVLTPTFKDGHGCPENERLLCSMGRDVHVLEMINGLLHTTTYPPEGITFLEWGIILLHAWITIHGQDSEGRFQSTTLRFNSVTDHIMTPFVERLRPVTTGDAKADLATERSRFNYLAQTHFKFMSYGRGSIRPGANVFRILLQPQIRREMLRLLGFSISRLVSPAHLTILTDSELILIRDDDSQRWTKGSPHGAIWTYVPRTKIIETSLSSAADGTQLLSIDLPGDLRIQALFDGSQGPDLEQMLHDLKP